MNYWEKSLPSLVRYLVGIVRNGEGLLGLVEDRGEEYWMTTVIPVKKSVLYDQQPTLAGSAKFRG
jgi:hypothetical protein